MLAVGLYDTGAPAPTAVTLGGNALTLATRVTSDVGEQTGIWYLANPPTGSQTLVFNHAGAIDEGAHFFWSVWEDVDTAGTPVDSLGSAVSGSNNATINTPTAGTINTGDVAVGVGCVFGSDGVALTGEVLDDTVFNQNDAAVGEITATGAAQFVVTSGDFPGISGIIIRNAAGGGPTINTEVLSDALTISDATVASALRNRLLESLLTISEGPMLSSTLHNFTGQSEITVSDQHLLHVLRHRLLTDGLDISDEALAQLLQGNILTRILSDTLNVSDSLLTGVYRNRIIDSLLTLSDESLSAMQRFVVLTDLIAVSDDIAAAVVAFTTATPLIKIGFDQPVIVVGQDPPPHIVIGGYSV